MLLLWLFLKNLLNTSCEQLTFPTNGKLFFDFTYRLPYAKRTCCWWCRAVNVIFKRARQWLCKVGIPCYGLITTVSFPRLICYVCTLQYEKPANFQTFSKLLLHSVKFFALFFVVFLLISKKKDDFRKFNTSSSLAFLAHLPLK